MWAKKAAINFILPLSYKSIRTWSFAKKEGIIMKKKRLNIKRTPYKTTKTTNNVFVGRCGGGGPGGTCGGGCSCGSGH